MTITHRVRGYNAFQGSTTSAYQLGSSQPTDCLKFTTKKKNINDTVTQCYVPTNNALDDKKEESCDQLQSVVNRQSDEGNTLLMKDLNAKIGDVNTGYEKVMGAHGLGRVDENGELLRFLCTKQSGFWGKCVRTQAHP